MAPQRLLLLLDLDGTLIDSASNILAGLRETFEAMGVSAPDDNELGHYIGPPVRQSFKTRAGLDEHLAVEAARHYGRISDAHFMRDVRLFPGAESFLVDAQELGATLAVATSKPQHQADQLLEEYGLSRWLSAVVGYEPTGHRESKAAIVAEAMRRIRSDGRTIDDALMVGDRIYDLEAAAKNGIDGLWASWGYGSISEASGALEVVDDFPALLKIVSTRIAHLDSEDFLQRPRSASSQEA